MVTQEEKTDGRGVTGRCCREQEDKDKTQGKRQKHLSSWLVYKQGQLIAFLNKQTNIGAPVVNIAQDWSHKLNRFGVARNAVADCQKPLLELREASDLLSQRGDSSPEK